MKIQHEGWRRPLTALEQESEKRRATLKHTAIRSLEHASPEQRRDRRAVSEAVTVWGEQGKRRAANNFRFASAELRMDREFVLAVVSRNGFALEHASVNLRQDSEVVLAAATDEGNSFKFASDGLRRDLGFIVRAIAGGAQDTMLEESFIYEDGVRANRHRVLINVDRQLALDAVRAGGSTVFELVSAAYGNDREIVLAAIETNGSGWALEYASEELCGDKRVVMAAVAEHGDALQFASEALRSDREIVLEAVRWCGSAFEDASDVLRRDQGFILQCIADGADREMVKEALIQCDNDSVELAIALSKAHEHGVELNGISEEYRNVREVVLAAVKSRGDTLQFSSRLFRGDLEVVLAAVKQNGLALQYVSPELRGNPEVVLAAVNQNGLALKYASQELKRNSEVAVAAVRSCAFARQYDSAVEICGLAIQCGVDGETLRRNQELLGIISRTVMAAIRFSYLFEDIHVRITECLIMLVVGKEKEGANSLHELKQYECFSTHVALFEKTYMDVPTKISTESGGFGGRETSDFQSFVAQLIIIAEQLQATKITYERVGEEPDALQSFLRGRDVNRACYAPKKVVSKTKRATIEKPCDHCTSLTISHGSIKIELEVEPLLRCLQIDYADLDKLIEQQLAPFSPKKNYPRKEYILDLSYPGVHPMEYVWNARKQPLGYKNERGEIILAPDAGGWESIFNSLKLSNLPGNYQFSEDFKRSLHGVLHHFIHPLAPGPGFFSQVLSSVKGDKPNQLKLEKALSEWLNTYSQANNPQINALNRYFDRDDPDAINDPIAQSMRQNHLSCLKRCQIFMAFMNFAGLGKKYCVVTNGCHAWIANSSGRAIDLGGVQADCRIKKQAVGNPAWIANSSGQAIDLGGVQADCRIKKQAVGDPAWIANSSGQAINLGGVQAGCRVEKQAVVDPAVHVQTPRFRVADSAESGKEWNPSSDMDDDERSDAIFEDIVNPEYFSVGPSLEVQQMMDKFECISGSLDEIQKTETLPGAPTSSCITADNLDTAYQELKKKYPDYPILIIHPGNYNHKELVAYKEKKDESGEKFIILFNIEYTPGKNGDDIYRSFQDQTTCKQACDSEEPKFNDVGTQNIPCMYFTGRNNTHVLPSLISRVPKNFNVSSSGPVFGPQPMTVSPEDPCISLAGFSIDDALCNIEITLHPEKAGFYSVNHKLPEEIGELLTPEEVASASSKVVILNVKEATLADRLKIEEFNHELLHRRPIFLNGSWRYGSLTFQLRINPELQQAPSSYILNPTPFDIAKPSESSISMAIERQTDHAQSDDAHEDAQVDVPSCQENDENIMVSVGSKLWNIETTRAGDYSGFSGQKTSLCRQIEATLLEEEEEDEDEDEEEEKEDQHDAKRQKVSVIGKAHVSVSNKATKSICLHGQISDECLDQLRKYFPEEKARIKVNGKSLVTGCHSFEPAPEAINPMPIDYARYSSSLSSSQTVTHVQGPCALYQCLQDHYQDKLIDDNPMAWSLKEWLGAKTVIQHVIIDGSSLTLEDRSILETLQKNDHQISCIHYQGNIYKNKKLDSVKFHIINPLVLLDGVQEQKVTVDSQYKQTICRIAMQKKDAKEEEQSQNIMIPDEVLACSSADNLALAARLSDKIKPEGLKKLFSENREKLRPFTSQDCQVLTDVVLDNYVNIRPEIASIIQLLRECAKDGLGFGVLLTGPPGIGKSLIANKLAASWGAKDSKEAGPNSYHIFDGHPREGDIERLTDFWNKGGSVCINEFENPIWQAELDRLKSTTPPHKDFFVIASSNFPPSSKTSFPILAQASWRIEEQRQYVMKKLAARFPYEFQVDELRKWIEANINDELSGSKDPLGARELDRWCGFIEEEVRSQLKLIAPKRKGAALFNNGGFHNGGIHIGGKKTRLQEGHAEPGSSSAADSSMFLSR